MTEFVKYLKRLINEKGQGIVEFGLVCAVCAAVLAVVCGVCIFVVV